MRTQKATINGEQVIVLNWSAVSAGRDEIHEFKIGGKHEYSIGMRADVAFKDKKMLGKILSVIPGTDRTTVRVSCPRKRR